MKQKMQNFWKAVRAELEENKNTFLVYTGLRFLVICVMILQIFNGNYQNVFLCLLTLALMIMPSVIQAAFKVEFPSPLEIVILVFIFAAEILGEISAFYIRFPYWDTILHTLNGFLCAALGLSLVDLMNRQKKMLFELSPLFMAIVAFCFSMTIGVFWEFFVLMTSFAMNPITMASRMNVVFKVISSCAATSTMARVIPFRIKPFQPARLSSLPVSVFFDLWKTAATIRPLM